MYPAAHVEQHGHASLKEDRMKDAVSVGSLWIYGIYDHAVTIECVTKIVDRKLAVVMVGKITAKVVDFEEEEYACELQKLV